MKFIRDFKTKEAYTNFKASSKRKTLTSHPESDTEEQVNLQGTDYEIYYKTSDNQSITLGTDEGFGATVESNEYPKYSGTVSFDNKPTTIPASSFSSQDTLTSVELPNSITTIESGSFSNSSNLNNVTINSETVSVAENSFNGVADTGKLTISNEELLDDVTFNNEFIGWNAYKSNGTFIETIQEKEIDYSQIPMFFENVDENEVTISVAGAGNPQYTVKLEYSSDGKNWENWGYACGIFSSLTYNLPKNSKLYIRNASNSGYFNQVTDNNYYYNGFRSTGSVSVGGNIMSLSYCDFKEQKTIEIKQAYKSVFQEMTTLVDASKLVLPATTLYNACYDSMFYGCTGLTKSPTVLPATTLADGCYRYMFNRCTGLTTAPELPATTLTSSCYYHMFSDCTSLTTAPELPATTLATYCYQSMFSGCTSLTTAPVLHATTLVSQCYYYMFAGCKSLTTAPELPATTLATECYCSMFSGCTSLTTAPTLPATTLAGGCYSGMFTNCTSLTTAPTLPATTLAGGCYSGMFTNCKSLTTALELPATTLASRCYDSMYSGCIGLTTAPELPATTLATQCYSAMFAGCTSLTTAPELPATTLADTCYSNMFYACTSLTTAPTLPATTLVSGCYSYMFDGCSKLNYIKAMFITLEYTTYTNNWVSGVASTGTFVKNVDATWDVTGPSGIPTGWVVEYNGTIDSIELVDETEIPETFYANQTSVTATVKVNYTKEDGVTTGSFTKVMTSNDFGENTTSANRNVIITFECSDKSTSVNRIQSGEYNYTISPMFFENVDENEVTISVKKGNTYAYTATLQTSTDGSTWTTWGSTSTTAITKNVPVGGKLYVRASTDIGYFNNNSNSNNYNYFTSSGVVNIGGNIMSLGYKNFEDKKTITQEHAYSTIFGNMYDKLLDVSKLVLPATTLAKYCYLCMFQSCTSLTTAPELPATTLATQCYSAMFQSCTSLTTAPELPATTLADTCYSNMFYACTSLTTAPTLPATTLVSGCYSYMFDGCSKLNYIKAMFITLEYTTYTNNWVSGVASTGTFVKCPGATWDVTGPSGIPTGWVVEYNGTIDSIELVDETEIPETFYANQTSVTATVKVNYTEEDGVTTGSFTKVMTSNDFGENTTGSDRQVKITFECEGKTTSVDRIQSGEYNYTNTPMFFENVGESEITIGVKKNNSSAYAATLQTSTDGSTWTTWGSTSTTAITKNVPVGGKLYVRASTDIGYFNNQEYNYNYFTSTGNVKVAGNIMSLGYKDAFTYKKYIGRTYAYEYVFYYMTKLVDASKLLLPATNLTTQCYQYMFFGCTSLTTAPALPATTLASRCYSNMFYACTSLTTAPELPSTSLYSYCYSGMFQGCTSLTTAPALPATTLATYCYQSMFNGCTSLTTAPELPATTFTSGCYEYMFNRCSKLNYIKALFTTTPSTTYTNNWVSGVASTGTFVKNVDATWDVTGANGVPSGWTVETASE